MGRIRGKYAPAYGYRPAEISLQRILIEVIINIFFFIGKTKFARYVIEKIPEDIIGPIFNYSRLLWKKLSRPTKRKGLAKYKVFID